MLTRLAALGLTVPLATLGLDRAAVAGSMSFLDRAELIDGLKALISTKSVVNLWLLGVSLFQRRSGSCRFAEMQISQPGAAPLRL